MRPPEMHGPDRRAAWLPRALAVFAVVAMLVTGCAPAPAPSRASSGATSSPVTSASVPAPTATHEPSPTPLSRDDGWRADIDALLEARERLHPDPWHGMARADWVAAADAVKARIPDMTDDEALTELVRLASMPGWAGRDGHSGIFPFIPGSGTHEYPITMWQFPEGLVITRARAPYESSVGSRIVAIEGRPIAEVLALTDPLAPRDNPSNLLAYGPLYLRVSELLAGVGVIDEPGPATFTLEAPSGATRDLVIEPILADDDVAWHGGDPIDLPVGEPLWLSRPTETLWWEVLPDDETLFVQYNVVEARIDPIVDEILARVQEGDIERVVVDLRHNGGGNLNTYRHFLDVLQDPAIDRPGRLVVLIGRLTFSAAATFATELEATTGAWFAGEAMGGSPNLYGDARSTDLVNSGQQVYIASRYHQISTPDDARVTIEPELPVPYTFDDYRAGRDPVLDTVLLEAVKGV